MLQVKSTLYIGDFTLEYTLHLLPGIHAIVDLTLGIRRRAVLVRARLAMAYERRFELEVN